MKQIYEAWQYEEEITFAPRKNIIDQKETALIHKKATLLHTIIAESWEEAMTMHHEKMGWEPYKPLK